MDKPTAKVSEGLIEHALSDLRKARDLLALAGAPKALDKVHLAIKSAEGVCNENGGEAAFQFQSPGGRRLPPQSGNSY